MKNNTKYFIFNEINNLPILKFTNYDFKNKNQTEKCELINDLIVHIGCRVDKLYSSLFDFSNNNNLSLKAQETIKVFTSITSFKTKKFKSFLKDFSIINGERVNKIYQQEKYNNLRNSEEIKLFYRMDEFYFMGIDCSIHVQKLWEHKQHQIIHKEAEEAHELLINLFDNILFDNMSFNESLEKCSSDNKIYNGFILILNNLNNLDSRSFSLEKNLKNCEVCKKYFFAENQNRKYFCSRSCAKAYEKENYSPPFSSC